MKKKVLLIGILIFAVGIFTSCKVVKNDNKDKIRDLEYTVLADENIPEIVKTKIEAEKANPFKFSYNDGEYLYVAIGYGEQPTGGYSIQVPEFYEAKEYIVIKTTLVGPAENDVPISLPSYPYVVIKTANLDLPVCFK